MANVVVLWHMHQPYYVNPLTREAAMPWVRLHCVKGYLDMITVPKDYPDLRLVFNLTPVLLQQIEEIVEGHVTDLWLERSRRPAAQLSEPEKIALLTDFFKAHWAHMVKPHPRYAELLQRRGESPAPGDLPRIAAQFGTQDFLDLQVWFNLAWCGYTACRRFPELAALKAKGRGFTEAEKTRLLEIHLEIMRAIVPAYRAAQERGQVELTTTPYFHPILPLVFDSAFAERSLPGREFPRRFHWPQDAAAQVTLAMDNHARLFGRRPRGLWPSEGSVAPEMIPLLQEAGIEYFCSDEENLFRSLHGDPAFSQAKVERVELFQGWRVEFNGSAVGGVFRDRPLSDFIGFTAARNPPEQAAAHLIGHLGNIADHFPARHTLIPIILDGENAWEQFPDSGEAFLRAFYKALCADPKRLRSQTLETHFREHPPVRALRTLHTGSWIGSNFDIWIGEPEENRAWDLLGDARTFLQEQIDAKHLSKTRREAALREVYAAEGSDWFWWYGPDFSTENDALFDALFRQHLKNIYLLCNATPPAELDLPIPGYAPRALRPPRRLIAPQLGRDGAEMEWEDAGVYLPGAEQGTMHEGGRLAKKLWFGCGKSALFLRLEFAQSAPFPPFSLRLCVTRPGIAEPLEIATAPLCKPGPGAFTLPESKIKQHTTLAVTPSGVEWKLSLREMGLPPGAPFGIQLALWRDGMEWERYPERSAIPLCA